MFEESGIPGNPAQGEQPRVLAVGHSEEMRAMLRWVYARLGWAYQTADTCGEALRVLRRDPVPVVITEENLPDGDWKLLLSALASQSPRPELIVYCDRLDDELWAEVLTLGGYDVLLGPLEAEEVILVTCLASQSPRGAQRTVASL